jgi:hypothetical protein
MKKRKTEKETIFKYTLTREGTIPLPEQQEEFVPECVPS